MPSKTTGVTVTAKKGMTKAEHGNTNYWIWKKGEQGDNKKGMGDAYIHSLSEGGSYWIKYSNVGLTNQDNQDIGGKYDITVTFNNASGKIDGADGYDIALFTGQLGAVRFRGYKYIDCKIDIYKHGTTERIPNSTKLGLRFMDIDCHQGLRVLTPGRVEHSLLGYKGKSANLKWGCPAAEDENKDNSVWYDGALDADDTLAKLPKHSALKYALRVLFHPAGDSTFKVRYYAGGADGIGTQKNGAFFSFDGYLGIGGAGFETSVDKSITPQNAKEYTITKKGDVFTYNIPITIADKSQGGTKLVMTDTFSNGIVPDANSVKIDGGTFTHSVNGQTLTVTADPNWLKTNPTGTFTVHINATIDQDLKKIPSNYWHADTETYVIPNTAHIESADADGTDTDDSSTVNVIVPMTHLTMDKVVDKYEHKMGEDVVWTLTLHNAGKNKAFDPVITDTIPKEYQITKVEGGKNNGNTVTSDAGDLDANGNKIVKVTTKAIEAANGIENYNTATGNCWNNVGTAVSDDAEEYTNTASLYVDKTIKKLEGNKKEDDYEYEVGDKAQFTVVVENKHDRAVANNVVIKDAVPNGMKLDPKSVHAVLSQTNFRHHVAGTADPTNELNGANDAKNYTNETEDVTLSKTEKVEGDNGFEVDVNYLPAHAKATVTFEATAAREGNGKEQHNDVTVTADNNNVEKVQDDSEYYINTADLSIAKKYINPYKADKNDNRYDNEYRVYEEKTGNEQVQYQVDVTSSGDDGTVARDVTVDDLTLPQGLALNYDSMKITETAPDNSKKEFTPAGGDGKTFKYHIAGTPDEPNKLNPGQYNETEDRTPKVTLTKSGNGWKLTDTYLPKGYKLTLSYTANATEDVNGDQIINTARTSAANVGKDKDGKYEIKKAAARVYINSPRLKIEKHADSEHYEVGDTVTYTITVSNTQRGTIGRNAVIDDIIKTPGVKLQRTSIALIDENGNSIDTHTYDQTVGENNFKVSTKRHLIVDQNEPLWDLENKKAPETLKVWNPEGPEYPGGPVTHQLKMQIEYQMVITDKELAGKDIINDTSVVTDEKLPAQTTETVTPNAPNLQVTKQADKHEFDYNQSKNPHYVVNIAQVRDAVIAHDVVVNDVFASKDIQIKPETLKVFLNDQDVTAQMKQITVHEDKLGYDIETGKDLGDSDRLRIEYDTELAPSSIGKELTNTVRTHAANASEKQATETILVKDTPAELLITKASDKKVYNLSDTGHYTVKVRNNADNSVARNVVIWDALEKKGEQIVKDSIHIKDEAGKDFTKDCTITSDGTSYRIETHRDMALNDEFTVTYDVGFKDTALVEQDVKNTAKAKGDNVPEVSADNQVRVIAPGLTVIKNSDKQTYALNDTAHYKVVVGESFDQAVAYQVRIHDEMLNHGGKIQKDTIKVIGPDGEDITKSVKSIKAEDYKYDIDTGLDLAKGQKITVTYDVLLDNAEFVGKPIPNLVRATADNATAEAENKVTPKETPEGLTISKDSDPVPGSTVMPGDNITYMIKVVNSSKKDLANIMVKDLVPVGTEYVSGGQRKKVKDGETVAFLIPSLKAGESAEEKFIVRVTADGIEQTRIDNVAAVKVLGDKADTKDLFSHADEDGFTNTNEVHHYVPHIVYPEKKENPVLTIAKRSDKKIYDVGETGHYTVVVGQSKKDLVAKNVKIKDALQVKGASIVKDSLKIVDPKGQDITRAVKITTTDTSYSIDTGRDLAYNETFTVTYDVNFTDKELAGKQVPNIAKAKSDNAKAETTNEVTPVTVDKDLTAVKTSDPVSGTVVKPGDAVTYHINVTNNSSDEQNNVYVMDEVPAKSTYQDGSATFTLKDTTPAQPEENAPEKEAEVKEGEQKTEGASETAPEKEEVSEEKQEETKDPGTEVSENEETKTGSDKAETEEPDIAKKAVNTLKSAAAAVIPGDSKEDAKAEESETEEVKSDDTASEESKTDDTKAEESKTTENAKSEDSSAEESKTDDAKAEDTGSEDQEAEKAVGTLEKVDGKEYICFKIGTIPAGKTADAQFTVTVNKDATEDDVVVNTALVHKFEETPENPWTPEKYTPTNTTTHPLDNWVTTTNTVDVKDPEAPQLGIEKTSDKNTYQVGETGHYTVTVTGVQGTTKDVVISDSLEESTRAFINDGSVKVSKKTGDHTSDVTKKVQVDSTKTGYTITTKDSLKKSEKFIVTYDVLFTKDASGTSVKNYASTWGEGLPPVNTDHTVKVVEEKVENTSNPDDNKQNKTSNPQKTSHISSQSEKSGGSSEGPNGSTGGRDILRGVQTGIESHEALFATIAAAMFAGAMILHRRRKRGKHNREKF